MDWELRRYFPQEEGGRKGLPGRELADGLGSGPCGHTSGLVEDEQAVPVLSGSGLVGRQPFLW